MRRNLIEYFTLVCFTSISFVIFNWVYKTSKLVIDEEFHLKQGLHYCNGRYYIYDPKITTFPGLYFISSLVLGPFGLCTDYFLRLTCFICSIFNFVLFYKIRCTVSEIEQKRVNTLEALTLSLLPPLYFFNHLYYTDVPALTTVLLMLCLALKERHFLGTFAAIASVAMRQTNIVWVGMVLGVSVLNYVVSRAHPFLSGKFKGRSGHISYTLRDIFTVIDVYLHRPDLIWTHFKAIMMIFYGYISVIVGFLMFLWYNGSIVIGDKCAHQASVHIPQIFYFSLFLTIFAPSLIISKLNSIFKLILRQWLLFLILAIAFAIIIRYNTLVHPYLLADNRHYTFYLWNRFYGKYEFARYIIIPIYLLSLSCLYCLLNENQRSTGFTILYIVCTIASIALQRLIEIRYFILPYIYLRLHLNNVKPKYILIELVLYLALNVCTFYLFFTKEIVWTDYKETQRLIW
uniref:Dol-P-Glc:Glc(2)Man(9)GlcNAc(2)-PP-Dol alpha-1,2-glucosyltransferase n=1 Tax=Culicoides sonorensis TaxID=179676 RepID=A0A336LNB5_CULSO